MKGVVSHCDTEELFGKVLLVFLLHNGQSSCLKNLVESFHTSKADRKYKRERIIVTMVITVERETDSVHDVLSTKMLVCMYSVTC